MRYPKGPGLTRYQRTRLEPYEVFDTLGGQTPWGDPVRGVPYEVSDTSEGGHLVRDASPSIGAAASGDEASGRRGIRELVGPSDEMSDATTGHHDGPAQPVGGAQGISHPGPTRRLAPISDSR